MSNSKDNASPLCVLIILDGFGIKESKVGNAVLGAKTPILDLLWMQCRSALLAAAGTDIGLGPDDPGNSETCHLNI
ncbi:MAG: 2,3-bisphosphoglycerate-independent phosphoglycerate mutase, partial [Patescibacteria group bacterium]|nr:2,3-bisphosphoglycerate-independent phosphoglycerate mutase [Patescibacteria group bacterium]